MWQIWVILAVLFIIFEMIIPTDFLVFWLGISAGITAICSLFIDNITIQIGIFCILSILLFFCTKKFVQKFTKHDENIKTNSYSLIDKTGIVTTEINPILGTGQVKVNNEIWSAKTNDNTIIPENTLISILSIDGVKVVVTTKEESKKE